MLDGGAANRLTVAAQATACKSTSQLYFLHALMLIERQVPGEEAGSILD